MVLTQFLVHHFSAVKHKDDSECHKGLFELLHERRLKEPGKFDCWPSPPIWCRGKELRHHIDVIMHLFFLGVVKTTMKLLVDFLIRRSRHESFYSLAADRLEGIRWLKLQW